jgi:hypothetical protein
MNKNPLKNLAEKRTAHYLSLKKNRDQSHKIIGEQLYSKQTHFIFELLQNAEDEGATKVKIIFNDDKLIFEHNGKAFDINDIEAITSFGNNERKKLKPNAIGRFGIGFKSVFSVTEKPEIKSGNFHFTISNFIVPNLINSEKCKETIITLPFKSSKQSHIISSIEKTLNELDSLYLLFLNNIQSIEIINEQNRINSRLLKLKKHTLKDSSLKIYSVGDGKSQKEFLLFENVASVGQKKLPIKIAFTINRTRGKIEFEQIDASPLFAFFATDKQTNLPFYIHAPFLTTPARDNIIENESRNEKLFLALSDLMVQSIDLMKTNRLIELKTWLVFPCNISFYKNEIYKTFCDSFFRYLLKKQTMILPTDNGKFCHVHNALKADDREIQKLVSIKETQRYFGRTEWVTQELNLSNFEIINQWLNKQYKVPTIGLWELCEKFDALFFAKQSDEWLLRFYSCISDEKRLWRIGDRFNSVGPLRNKAFIRTSKNKMIKPLDSQGNITVYLPTEGTSNYQFVKSIFLDDKESKRLFRSLNITIPDLIAEVNEHVIPKIEKSTTAYKGMREDVLKIFRAIRKADDDEERNLIQKLKRIAWLPGRNNLSKRVSLYKPDEIYYPSRELTTFLGKSPTANFLDSSLFPDHKARQSVKSTLEDVGVLFRPRRFYSQDNKIIFENKDASTQNYWNGDDIELEGLKEYLRKAVDKKISVNLWNALAKFLDGWKQSGFDDTKFIQQLQESKWLFNKFGQRLRPSEITPLELYEAYDNSDILMNVLNFKADEIKNFELEHGGKFLSNDQLQNLKEEMDEMRREIERLKNQYEPEEEVEEFENDLPDIENVESIELSAGENLGKDNIPENHQIDDFPFLTGGNSFPGIMVPTVPTKRQKRIGARGEEFVLKLLRAFYKHDTKVEIEDLNDNDKLGVGCDIIVRRNGIAETLIEVKSTEGGYENKFKISEKQWLTALKSHLNTDEPEYHIYCVYYAGGTNLQHIVIKDPVNWMLQKKLRFVELWFNVLIKRT